MKASIVKQLLIAVSFTSMTFASINAAATTRWDLTPGDWNDNIEGCYEQTLIAKNQKTSLTAETIACERVIFNKLKPKRIVAIARFNRGVIHFHQGLHLKAIEDFEIALQLMPSLFQAHIALANIALKAEKPALALTHFNHAIDQQPDNAALKQIRNHVSTTLQASNVIENETKAP